MKPIDLNRLIFIDYINYIDWFLMTNFHRLGTPGYEPTPENDHSRQILLPTSVENVWSTVRRTCKAILGGVYMTPGRLSPRSEFTPVPSHGSISFYIHDTATKCHDGASHPGVSSPRFSYRGENFTPERNLATVSCKRETTSRFGVKSVCR